jgi:penicillin amidase
MVITANQNPFPVEWKYPVHGDFDPGYRALQIRSLLTARQGWKPEDMVVVQKDVYSPFLHALSQEVVRAAGSRQEMTEAVGQLRNWNGQVEKGLAAPMIMQLFYQEMRRRLAERASPDGPAAYTYTMAPAAVLDITQRRPAGWFPDWNKVIAECLSRALDEGRRSQGGNLAKWEYGAMFSLELKHPVVSQVPYLGRYFNIGPVPMSGASTTVKQTSARIGPSMRFVADTSDWAKSLNSITLGQSGQVLSSHYKDQWDTYWRGESLPMPWGSVAGDVLRFQPER